MSLEFVRLVDREHPELLQQNVGRTCHQFTVLVVDKLRQAGREAFLICKSPGEGQYTPPGFQRRIVIGLDGKEHLCSGVSHDAIWCDGKQYDVAGSANSLELPLYRKRDTMPVEYSIDPAVGPRMTAHPSWNEIEKADWRPNNPPLDELTAETSVPVPGPVVYMPPAYPSYESLGGDTGGAKITRQLEADYIRARRPGLDGDCGVWVQRVCYDFLTRRFATIEEAIAAHRVRWCQALGIPVTP